MKQFNKLALAVLATAAISASAFAGTVTLKQKATDKELPEAAVGAEFRLGVVAKIKGVVELDLINDGFTSMIIEEAGVQMQSFAFGQKTGTTGTIESEKFAIDSNAADLQTEACVSAAPESIQRLTDYGSVNVTGEEGSCLVGADATVNKVNASFLADYALRSSGGLQADLVVDNFEDGVDADYSTLNPDKKYIASSVEDVSTNALPLDAAILGSGGDIDHGDKGALKYSLEFDISGAASQAESRIVFSHILVVK